MEKSFPELPLNDVYCPKAGHELLLTAVAELLLTIVAAITPLSQSLIVLVFILTVT